MAIACDSLYIIYGTPFEVPFHIPLVQCISYATFVISYTVVLFKIRKLLEVRRYQRFQGKDRGYSALSQFLNRVNRTIIKEVMAIFVNNI